MATRSCTNGVLPKFFKVYLPSGSGNDLVLPVSFNSFLPKPLPISVTVRSIYGKIWKMALRKCCDGDDDVEKYALVNGWKRIVKDLRLNGGDFLTFEFDGSRCFNFCIYEHRTMCKRLRRSSVQTKKNKADSDGEDKSRDSEDVMVLKDDDDAEDSDYVYTDDNDAGDDCTDENDADDSTVDAETKADGDDAKGEAKAEADDDDDDDGQYLDDRENPSFKMTLNPKKKSQLRIPAHVINDYGLNFSENITVVDPVVKKFGPLVNKVKIQTNGCVFIKKFGSVIRRNKVKTTDKMIFELKKNGGNVVHTIKVYIIRG